MGLNLKEHPCFNEDAKHSFGRIHLPVAPKCNIQCNFCDRKHDCVNESRPGVSSGLLSPRQALAYLQEVMKHDPRIRVVGIAGPGEPFANAEATMETLRLARAAYPDMLLCVASNGLEILPYVEELAQLQVSHVSLTVNAVNAEIGSKVYRWVRFNKQVYRDVEAAELLLDQQIKAVQACKRVGLVVKINNIVIPGVNDEHVGAVAARMAKLGADLFNAMPLYPVEGTPFGSLETPSGERMKELRAEAEQYLPQMRHCARCRADAVGLLGEEVNNEILACLQRCAEGQSGDLSGRPHVAVATMDGVLINEHLGRAPVFGVYGYEQGAAKLIAQRQAPPAGGGDERWQAMAQTLADCRAVFVGAAGQTPCAILEKAGLHVMVTEGLIDQVIQDYYEGRGVRAPAVRRACGGCSGVGCAS